MVTKFTSQFHSSTCQSHHSIPYKGNNNDPPQYDHILPDDVNDLVTAVSCDPALVLVDVISALRLMLPVVSCELIPSGHHSTAPCNVAVTC